MNKSKDLVFTQDEVYNMLFAIAFYAENSAGNLNKEVEATVLKVQSIVKLQVDADGTLRGSISRPITFQGKR